MTTQNPLIGQTIQQIHISDDKQKIKFLLTNLEEIVAECDADCCSYTWIEDLIHPNAALYSPVINAFDIDMPNNDEIKEDGDYIQNYGFAIETMKGRFTIAYRNESNGYYGGNLTWPNDYHYGGVFGQNNSKSDKWRLVNEK